MSGEMWGGIAGFTGITTRLDQTDKRIGRLDERLKEAKQELRADIRDAKTELSAHIQASEGRLHAAIENLRRESQPTLG